MREPTRNGGSVTHRTDLMFLYQRGAFSGLDAKAATSAHGRAMTVELTTSTAMARVYCEL
jgi:hypothetical protein